MTIYLKKGQKINLSKEKKGLSKIFVALGWDEVGKNLSFFQRLFSNPEDIDCDASALLLSDGKVSAGYEDIVYFGNLKHKTGAVYHSGDNLTGAGEGDSEVINVDLSSLPKKYDGVVFVVNIYKARERDQHFGMLTNAYIRIVDVSTKNEICRYILSDNYDRKTAMIVAKLTKENDEWHFDAIGEATNDNRISEMADRFR
ncbi:MAG: TerD family protein [Candidatus Riflebacteria bacterium]|jgi:stress response protein SCP2|nr:TerD family protein [Candidatus Riflebacteria bacterium]